MAMKNVRTRFAPSPTGYMHIGSLRTALYAYLFAKHHGGTFILRIEDTDQKRYVEGAVEAIYTTLKDAGLHYDEGPDIGGDYGPYIQSARRELYTRYAEELVNTGHAYYCFCDESRLEMIRHRCKTQKLPPKYDGCCKHLSDAMIRYNLEHGKPFVIRQNITAEGTTTFHDLVLGDITYENHLLDDQVLLKSDGLPTYNFANVIDDHLMKITHVIRGTEFLPSTPKYNLLYDAFGWEVPVYIHLPLITNSHGAKLGKRFGDTSYRSFLDRGYLKETLLNYVLLLGWNPGDGREIFTLEEMIEVFDVKRLSKSPAIFDEKKLAWMNGEYLRKLPPDEFYATALPYLKHGISRSDVNLVKVSKLLHPRIEKLSDIPEQVDFFDRLPEYGMELYAHKKMKTTPATALIHLHAILPELKTLNEWNEDTIRHVVLALIERSGVKNGQVFWPLRVALSGKRHTPGGGIELAAVLGKTETIRRIEHATERLQQEHQSNSLHKKH